MENNPLKQYFRRPSIYFKLPSQGKYYDEGVVSIPPNQELPVYPMTAIDEMTVRTPDALFNGAAVISLIKSCIPNILDPWKINNIDLDAIMVAIKAASGDGKMEIETTCPSCNESSSYDINLMGTLENIKNVDYDKPMIVNELTIKFKPLTYTEVNQNSMNQFEIQKLLVDLQGYEDSEEKQTMMIDAIKKLNELITSIIATTIESIQTPEVLVTDKTFIKDYLNNTDRETSNAIKENSLSLKSKSEIPPLNIVCSKCQNEYEQKIVLNVTDFFD